MENFYCIFISEKQFTQHKEIPYSKNDYLLFISNVEQCLFWKKHSIQMIFHVKW